MKYNNTDILCAKSTPKGSLKFPYTQKERIEIMADNQNSSRSYRGKKSAESLREERRAAREAVLALLFETEYHKDENPETIYLRAVDARDIDPKDKYIRKEYLGIMEHLPTIDALLGRHAKGWRTDRLSRVSRAVLRLGAYEVVYADKIPAPIAINEAVELAKKFDDPKARAFINGVLNAIKNELEQNGGVIPEVEAPKAETAETAETAEAVEAVEAAETDAAAETAADTADAE
jgi:N utilization substance protein B